MLDVHALSVNLSAQTNLFELARHPLHRLSEHGELGSHPHYVVLGCHVGQNFMPEEKGATGNALIRGAAGKGEGCGQQPRVPRGSFGPAYALGLTVATSLRTAAASSLRGERWPLSRAVGLNVFLRFPRPGHKYLAGTF
jgi:hypothetical protein